MHDFGAYILQVSLLNTDIDVLIGCVCKALDDNECYGCHSMKWKGIVIMGLYVTLKNSATISNILVEAWGWKTMVCVKCKTREVFTDYVRRMNIRCPIN